MTFSDVFGPVRMYSDVFGCIQIHSDAFGIFWKFSDDFGDSWPFLALGGLLLLGLTIGRSHYVIE